MNIEERTEQIKKIMNFWKHEEGLYDIEGIAGDIEDIIEDETEKAVKELREDILRMSVETSDLSFHDGFFKARDIILHNIQEYLDGGQYE